MATNQGIQQRVDLLSPLQDLMAKVGDAFKGALPSDAKVKIELETTPLQEVEASIARTQGSATDSASSKLGAQGEDPFAKSNSAREEIEKSMVRMEAIAGRIGYLIQKIDAGKDATGNAAQEIERLRDSLEKVAQKGRDAAKSLGDEGLASKITETEAAAGMGQGGRRGGEGGGASVADLMNMIRNPQGMAQGGIMQALQGLLGGGGGGGALMATLGVAAAAIGGVYGGWKINDKLAGEATSDGNRMMADATLSSGMGGQFDFRGAFFNEKRLGPRSGDGFLEGDRTRSGHVVGITEARNVLRGMGIGLNNWQSQWSAVSDEDSIRDTSMQVSRYAYRIGASTEQVAGMVGASVRTGAIQPNDFQIHRLLGEIARSTEEAAKSGVSTNEKLAVISSLNQRTVSETGMLSSASAMLNLKASNTLDATGDPALKGQLGMGALGTLAGNGGDDAKARQIGFMLDSSGNLLPEYQEIVDANPHLQALAREAGPKMAALAILDNPTLRAAVNQRGIRAMVNAGASPLLAGRQLGVRSGSLTRDYTAINGIGLGAGDILSRTVTPDFNDPINDASTPRAKERRDSYENFLRAGNREEGLKTGYDQETAAKLNEAATNLNSAANNLGRWLSDGTLANLASPFGIARQLF